MAIAVGVINADEKTWQGKFYETLFGNTYLEDGNIFVDRSTDGYTKGILFEHKQDVRSYGESKALSQALIYLCRFNRDGVPVPAKICLVGQEEQKCYIYDTANYMHIVNDIPKYANMKASEGIPGFSAGIRSELISFDMEYPLRGMLDILKFVQQAPQNVKVDINVHNVYGWANYYYEHAKEYKQTPEKKKFFEELRAPKGALEAFINPWTGQETDFKYIMDILNDPATQKELGAFYTPPAYAKKASELVKKAIERVPEGNDYVIIDRCAGTGNLEMYLDDGNEDILSHVIVSTYELKEWMVLKDRYNGRVRYIIPPVPANPVDLPNLNEEGFLSGANALTRDIIDNPVVKRYLNNPKCTIILFENPPYVESTATTYGEDGTAKMIKTKADWKASVLVQEMCKEVSGVATNDMGNVFIWTAFKYFLRQPTDSYVVFSPVKYWKAHKLIEKKFISGYAFNRRGFHTSTEACVMCALWSNKDDAFTKSITLDAVNLVNDETIEEGTMSVKQVFSTFSDVYFDNRVFASDEKTDVVLGFDGTETNNKATGITPIYNPNIVAYMLVSGNGFDNPRLSAVLVTTGIYKGHGFYVRNDAFLDKLPMFASSRYTDNYNNWKVMSMVMKSGDRAEQYKADVASGKLDFFLHRVLIWTGLTHYSHMRSFKGSDGHFYRNELCFDNLDEKTTLARETLDKFIANGYDLSDEEKTLFEKWNAILEKVHETDEYNSDFTYGLYQIDEEINIKIQKGVKKDGSPIMVIKYGDLNNLIKELKGMVKSYYLNNLVDTLFEYEFLK